jgi:hypothetical protein
MLLSMCPARLITGAGRGLRACVPTWLKLVHTSVGSSDGVEGVAQVLR